MAGDTQVVELDPILTTQVAAATNATDPGSRVARAFMASLQQLALE